MKGGLIAFHRWVSKNPLYLWWSIFLPLMLVILFTSWDELTVPMADTAQPPGFIPQLVQSFTLVALARVVLVAIGVVLIMICLFFPLFRVGKEGVQWTREQEEEITRASAEIIGAEVEELIQQESFRWSIIHRWLRFYAVQEGNPGVWLRDLVATILEAFPKERLSITLQEGEKLFVLQHPLLSKLVIPDGAVAETFGLKLRFRPDYALYFYLYADEGGLSAIDEHFLLILCEIFGGKAQAAGVTWNELVAYFQLVNNPMDGSGIK